MVSDPAGRVDIGIDGVMRSLSGDGTILDYYKLNATELSMTLDLISYMIYPSPSLSEDNRTTDSRSSSPLSPIMTLPYKGSGDGPGMRMEVVAPSLASVFPRFSYPDVNFWIW